MLSKKEFEVMNWIWRCRASETMADLKNDFLFVNKKSDFNVRTLEKCLISLINKRFLSIDENSDMLLVCINRTEYFRRTRGMWNKLNAIFRIPVMYFLRDSDDDCSEKSFKGATLRRRLIRMESHGGSRWKLSWSDGTAEEMDLLKDTRRIVFRSGDFVEDNIWTKPSNIILEMLDISDRVYITER